MAYVMKKHAVTSLEDAKRTISQIGSDPASIPIMAPKAVFNVIQIEQVVMQDALIIKQDMLSIGGEVAISKDAFDLAQQPGPILLMGTLAQFTMLLQKLRRHYPRIATLSDELETFIQKTI